MLNQRWDGELHIRLQDVLISYDTASIMVEQGYVLPHLRLVRQALYL